MLTKATNWILVGVSIMRVAIVHDYFHDLGGAERVVESWLKIYPDADIYTAFFVPEKMMESKILVQAWKHGRVHTSFEQAILGKQSTNTLFKPLFWLHPLAMSLVKVEGYDLVLISSVYSAKNARFINNEQIIHYCHSPARFLYDGMETEMDHEKFNFFVRLILKPVKYFLRVLDQRAAKNLIQLGAKWLVNSKYNQKVIKEIYGAESEMCYPPIDWEKFAKNPRSPDTQNPFYLYYGRVVHIKRPDLAIKVCLEMGKRLIISGNFGTKEYESELKRLVSGHKNADLIEFKGRLSLEENLKLFEKCQAMLFPGREDFGIAPIELLFAGVPVIAYKKAGALEYIQDGVNGLFFNEQTVTQLQNAILRFEKLEFNTQKIRQSVEKFKTNQICQFLPKDSK